MSEQKDTIAVADLEHPVHAFGDTGDSELVSLRRVHKLAIELCDAVDAMEFGVGGHRPINTILGEPGPATAAVPQEPRSSELALFDAWLDGREIQIDHVDPLKTKPTDDTFDISDGQILDWLQERAEEGCVTMCFEIDGGVHVTLEPMGGVESAAATRTLFERGFSN